MVTREINSQYEGEYFALIFESKGSYELKASDDPVDLLREIQTSSSRGYFPIRSFEDISWKALRDIETEIERANRGFEVDFNTILPDKNL